MKYSKKCIEMIKGFEGCVLHSYKCIDSEEYYTIGYGHYGLTNPNVTIDESTAENFLIDDMNKCADALDYYVDKYGYNFNQYQYDALISFIYNLGTGILEQLTQAGTRSIYEIGEHMLYYYNSGGVPVDGLIARREAEQKLYLSGIYPDGAVNNSIDNDPDELNENSTINDIVDAVIADKFGKGEDRKNALFELIQKFVNKRY